MTGYEIPAARVELALPGNATVLAGTPVFSHFIKKNTIGEEVVAGTN